MRPQLVRHKGFTLIELLTVIAIIGILASFLLPAVTKARFNSRMAKVRADLRALADACDAYFAEHGTYPPMGNDWVRVGPEGPTGMGPNGVLSADGRYIFFFNEDVGTDGEGPYNTDGTVNTLYTGPDANGTEGNYQLDSTAEDANGNGRLDGTFYERIGAIEVDVQRFGMIDEWAAGDTQLYHYYAGVKTGPPSIVSTSVGAALTALQRSQPMYNAFVVYSVGPDNSAHGLNNLYTTIMDWSEDQGDDNYRADPFDQNGNGIFFDTDQETTDVCAPGVPCEGDGLISTGENDYDSDAAVDQGDDRPVFDYDVRSERVTSGAPEYAMPGDNPNGDGVIMLVRGI